MAIDWVVQPKGNLVMQNFKLHIVFGQSFTFQVLCILLFFLSHLSFHL